MLRSEKRNSCRIEIRDGKRRREEREKREER
jgi:hypothetical protein